MRDCVRFAPMIGSREGELSAEEARALEAHLATCDRCSAAAADLAATEGMIPEALLAKANARDFSTFADEVMARVERAERPGLLGWFRRHRPAAVGTALVPVLAALAVIVYVRVEGGREPPVAMLELSSEGEATTVLQTADGPVVLLQEESGS